mgnify:CR=1 FL=1
MTTSNGAPLDWRAVFRVTRIFGSSRLALGLLLPGALLLVALFAYGTALDAAWSLWSDGVQPTEIDDMATSPATTPTVRSETRFVAAATLLDATQETRDSLVWLWPDLAAQNVNPQFAKAIEDIWREWSAELLAADPKGVTEPRGIGAILASARKDELSCDDLLDRTDKAFEVECDRVLELIDKKLAHITTRGKEQIQVIYRQPDEHKTQRDAFLDSTEASVSSVRLALTRRKNVYAQARHSVSGSGVFRTFFNYQADVFHQVVRQASQLNFFGGVGTIFSSRPMVVTAKSGALVHLMRSLRALKWFVQQHCLFATLYLIGALVLWSLLGGAMYRMVAVRNATGEKLGLAGGLAFAKEHFWSYFTAPLTPLLALAILAAVVTLIGLVGSIPSFGIFQVIAAILFVVVLLVGLASALTLVGMTFGVGLMFPAIAVEGTDRFDAVSRSFNYVFVQPWRLVFYGVVCLLYGALSYLFVRTVAFLSLLAAHTMLKSGAIGGGSAMGPQADWVDSIYPAPTFWDFHSYNFAATGTGGDIAGGVLSVWVYLVIALVGGYALAFMASSSTVLYTMLRNTIDGADFSDVYLESEADSDPLVVTVSEELLAKESQPEVSAPDADAQPE